jgi:RNA polymerase sigma factor (sigma-70 family)
MAESAQNPNDARPNPDTSRQRGVWTHSAFFRTYAPRLETLIRSRLSRRFQVRFDAEDIVQSAFRSFFLRQDLATPPRPASSTSEHDLWPLLAEIAVRKLSQQIRRHSAQRRSVVADVENSADLPARTAGPDEFASVSEIIALVQEELDESSCRAFSLRLDGFEILEIAEHLAISERTVRRHLSAAKKILERLLELQSTFPEKPLCVNATNALPVELNFPDYVLHQWIGDGAVGNVYRATEKSSGRTVAVKFLKKAFRNHSQAVASFRREVQIVAQLDHPGIIRILGLGRVSKSSLSLSESRRSANVQSNQGTFLVMDWAPGGDLARHTIVNRPPLDVLRNWALELTAALEHAHRQGVIHCDLKPSNVLIGSTGQLLVSDFGLARQRTGWSDSNRPHGGTPGFIAPELVDPSWGEIGPWTDTFGLGAILYNLLTGKALYEGENLDAILGGVIGSNPIRWPASVETMVPQEWMSVCKRLLAKPISARFPDMCAVSSAIESIPE